MLYFETKALLGFTKILHSLLSRRALKKSPLETLEMQEHKIYNVFLSTNSRKIWGFPAQSSTCKIMQREEQRNREEEGQLEQKKGRLHWS